MTDAIFTIALGIVVGVYLVVCVAIMLWAVVGCALDALERFRVWRRRRRIRRWADNVRKKHGGNEVKP